MWLSLPVTTFEDQSPQKKHNKTSKKKKKRGLPFVFGWPMTWNGMTVASPAACQVNVTGFTSQLLQQSTFCYETNDTCCPLAVHSSSQLMPHRTGALGQMGNLSCPHEASVQLLHIWFCIFSDTLSSKNLTFFFFLMTLRPVGLRKICQLRIWFLASKKSRVSIWMVFKSILALASARACPVHQASSFVTQRGDQSGVALRPIPHFLKLNELLKGGSFTAQCFLFSAKKSKRMQ